MVVELWKAYSFLIMIKYIFNFRFRQIYVGKNLYNKNLLIILELKLNFNYL